MDKENAKLYRRWPCEDNQPTIKLWLEPGVDYDTRSEVLRLRTVVRPNSKADRRSRRPHHSSVHATLYPGCASHAVGTHFTSRSPIRLAPNKCIPHALRLPGKTGQATLQGARCAAPVGDAPPARPQAPTRRLAQKAPTGPWQQPIMRTSARHGGILHLRIPK